MTDNEVRKLLMILEPYIAKIVQNTINNTGVVRRAPAKVITADNDVMFATVRLLAANTEDEQIVTLANNTGVALRGGMNVWVEYVYSLDNGFISMLNDTHPWST